MKRYFFFSVITISSLLAGRTANAQVNNGEFINVPAGTYMNIQGDSGLLNNGTVNNAGTIIIDGHFTNNGVFNSGPVSRVILDGPALLSTLLFQRIGGIHRTRFNDLKISGTGNKKCYIDEYIAKTLIFDPAFPEKVIIGNNNLTLLSLATISNPANDKFVVTDGTGKLVKDSVQLSFDFLFPVGDAVNSYKPVTLNPGVVDTFGVRVMPGVHPTTGSDQECVQYTYIVESTTGVNNASLKFGWNTADQGTSFQSPQAYMWQNTNGVWGMLDTSVSPLNIAGASPNSPATDSSYHAYGITDFSSIADSFIVRSYQILAIVSQDTSKPICENSSTVSFSVTATGPGIIQYLWQKNCGSGWSNINLSENPPYSGMQTNTLTISNPVMGMNGCQYQCIVSDQFNSITSQPATLTVNSLPNAYAGNDTTILIGNSVQLAATGGTSYVWTPSTYLDNPNVSNPISTSPLADISYIVYVTDANSCTASDTINITVDDAENIFIPNIFSPNGDGQNDILYVRGKGIKDIEFIVYDRWGEKIFETTTFNDITKGWDGTYKGKKLSTAVFVWYAKGTFYSGGIIDKKGNITLIRKNN